MCSRFQLLAAARDNVISQEHSTFIEGKLFTFIIVRLYYWRCSLYCFIGLASIVEKVESTPNSFVYLLVRRRISQHTNVCSAGSKLIKARVCCFQCYNIEQNDKRISKLLLSLFVFFDFYYDHCHRANLRTSL
jgi:hypothetical protein